MRYLIVLLLLITSCKTPPEKVYDDIKKASPDIENHIETVNKSTTSIDQSADETIKEADGIKKVAANISKTVPNESKEIDSRADNIKELQNSIKKASQDLKVSNQNLANAQQRVAALEAQNTEKGDEITKLREELAKEKEAKKAALFSKLVYVIILSIILGAICIVVAIRGETKAFWGAAVCGAVIVISLGISFYSTQLAIVGAIAVVAGLVLVVWQAYSEYTNRKANDELVETVEVAKQTMSHEEKLKVFGDRVTTGQAHVIQSPTTKAIVNKTREKKKKFWEPTINARMPSDVQ
jgi:hypothetical protein